VHRASPPCDDVIPGRDHPQRQVGVLAVGPPEAFVEATDALQRGPPVGHVCRDPPCVSQAGGAAFGIGGAAIGGQRHLDASLTCAHIRGESVEVSRQLGGPARSGHDIVIEKRDPLGAHRAPAGVTGCGRSPSPRPQQPHRDTHLGHLQCLPVARGPVVNQHYLCRGL
jgi:hypothetical protein